MARASLSDVWDETRGFVAREWQLLLPVTLATIGAGALLFSLGVPPPPPGAKQPVPGPWVLLFIPYALLLLTGSLALSILVLRPGVSVGEALTGALRRLGAGIVVAVLQILAGALIAFVPIVALTLVGLAAGLSQEATAALSISIIMPLVLWIYARVSLAVPIVATGEAGAVAALRRSFALTRANGWRLALLIVATIVLTGILSLTLQVTLGSVLLILGRVAGLPTLAPLIVTILTAALGAAIQAVLIVYLAMLYRRSSSGI